MPDQNLPSPDAPTVYVDSGATLTIDSLGGVTAVAVTIHTSSGDILLFGSAGNVHRIVVEIDAALTHLDEQRRRDT